MGSFSPIPWELVQYIGRLVPDYASWLAFICTCKRVRDACMRGEVHARRPFWDVLHSYPADGTFKVDAMLHWRTPHVRGLVPFAPSLTETGVKIFAPMPLARSILRAIKAPRDDLATIDHELLVIRDNLHATVLAPCRNCGLSRAHSLHVHFCRVCSILFMMEGDGMERRKKRLKL